MQVYHLHKDHSAQSQWLHLKQLLLLVQHLANVPYYSFRIQ